MGKLTAGSLLSKKQRLIMEKWIILKSNTLKITDMHKYLINGKKKDLNKRNKFSSFRSVVLLSLISITTVKHNYILLTCYFVNYRMS